jgi:hypothetical protein
MSDLDKFEEEKEYDEKYIREELGLDNEDRHGINILKEKIILFSSQHPTYADRDSSEVVYYYIGEIREEGKILTEGNLAVINAGLIEKKMYLFWKFDTPKHKYIGEVQLKRVKLEEYKNDHSKKVFLFLLKRAHAK